MAPGDEVLQLEDIKKGIGSLKDFADSLTAFIDAPSVKVDGLKSINYRVMEFFRLVEDAGAFGLDAHEIAELQLIVDAFHGSVAKKYEKIKGNAFMAGTEPALARAKEQTAVPEGIVKAALRAEKIWADLVEQIPINEIFAVEFKTLGTPLWQQVEIREKYENYVSDMMEYVSIWLGAGGISKADPKRLAEAVNKKDESELFSYMSNVFYKDLGASKEAGKLLSVSMQDSKFNCYSSTVLFADALERMGKRVGIASTSVHVFIVGEEFALETVKTTDTPAFAKALLDSEYPHRHETDAGKLLAITYEWSRAVLMGKGMKDKALDAIDDALKIDPENAWLIGRKGLVLHEMSRNEEALVEFNRALAIDPADEATLYNKGLMLQKLGRGREALAAYDAALKLDSRDRDAWQNKSYVLLSLGMQKEADECFEKANELGLHQDDSSK